MPRSARQSNHLVRIRQVAKAHRRAPYTPKLEFCLEQRLESFLPSFILPTPYPQRLITQDFSAPPGLLCNMVTPPEATPRNRQTTKSPAADTRVPGATHAVEIPKLPASSRKRAPPEDLIDIKVEDDGGVLSTPLAAASHAAKRRKAGHVRQPDLARPGLPLTPLSDRCRLQTTASPPIAASGPSQANISPLSPPSSKKPLRRRTLDDAFDRDSAYKSDDEIVAVEDSPQIVLQSVEPDDVQLGEDDMSISSKLMQQIQSNTSMQGSEDDQVEVQLSQNTKKRSRIKGLAPESNPDDDAPEDWRREQIMLNAVLKARDEFSLLPSSWKVHFSGGPSTDRMFYRRVKEKSFRPRIYARCEKYEITGTYDLPRCSGLVRV